jgi:hypothetical protein
VAVCVVVERLDIGNAVDNVAVLQHLIDDVVDNLKDAVDVKTRRSCGGLRNCLEGLGSLHYSLLFHGFQDVFHWLVRVALYVYGRILKVAQA